MGRMNRAEPTPDELTEAYKTTGLRKDGWSYQKVMMTESTRISLRNTAIALRNKKQQLETH